MTDQIKVTTNKGNIVVTKEMGGFWVDFNGRQWILHNPHLTTQWLGDDFREGDIQEWDDSDQPPINYYEASNLLDRGFYCFPTPEGDLGLVDGLDSPRELCEQGLPRDGQEGYLEINKDNLGFIRGEVRFSWQGGDQEKVMLTIPTPRIYSDPDEEKVFTRGEPVSLYIYYPLVTKGGVEKRQLTRSGWIAD